VVEKNHAYSRECIVFAEPVDFLIGPSRAAKRRLELTSLVNIEHKVAHSRYSIVMMFLIVSRALPRSSNVSTFHERKRKLSNKKLVLSLVLWYERDPPKQCAQELAMNKSTVTREPMRN